MREEGTFSAPFSSRPPSSLSLSFSFSLSGDDLGHVDTNGNFWDLGHYKNVLKRINTGAKLCDELVKMMNER